jgi:hypothetical protein
VDRRIRRLEALKAEPERMIAECTSERISGCRVLKVLRDHAECLSDHPADMAA